MGVLQTTVAEIVTVKEHQRELLNAVNGRSRLTQTSASLQYHALCLVFRVCHQGFTVD